MVPDPKRIDKLINESGNAFNFEVANFLRGKGWTVIISPYYTDSITEKPREIDILAEKSFQTYDVEGVTGCVNLQLHIECKYINDITVYWFDKPEYDKFYKKIAHNIRYHEEHLDLKSGLETLAKDHHYLTKTEVAKLYSSKTSLKNEQEVMFKAINQSLSSSLYFRNKGAIIKNFLNIKAIVSYPIIICKNFDNYFRADDKSAIKDDFLLEINYAYKNNDHPQEEYFLIDILNFNNFSQYLDNLEKNEVSYIRTFAK